MASDLINEQSGQPFKLSAERLTLAALTLWVASLFLPAVVLERSAIRGAALLLSAWGGTLAWFANPLILWAAWRLMRGKSSTVAAWLAAGLAVYGLVRSTSIPDLLDPPTPIHGYGWGLVLWMLSIMVMVVATYVRRVELRAQRSSTAQLGKTSWVVLARLVVVVISALLLTGSVRSMLGTPAELARMTAWSRVSPCNAASPQIVATDFASTGSIELVIDSQKNLDSRSGRRQWQAVSIFNVRNMLAWGIPVVRWQDRDYSYVVRGDDRHVLGQAATHPVSARLHISDSMDGDRTRIQARLLGAGSDTPVFERAWKQNEVGRFCPQLYVEADLSRKPDLIQGGEPQTLIEQAKRVPPVPELMRRYPEQPAKQVDEPTQASVDSIERSQTTSTGTNCPLGTSFEWLDRKPDLPPLGYPSRFRVNHAGKQYMPINGAALAARCGDASSIYLLSYQNSQTGSKVFVQKRRLDDFALLWERHAQFAATGLPNHAEAFDIAFVDERAESLRLGLMRRDTRFVYTVNVPIRP